MEEVQRHRGYLEEVSWVADWEELAGWLEGLDGYWFPNAQLAVHFRVGWMPSVRNSPNSQPIPLGIKTVSAGGCIHFGFELKNALF